MGIDVTAMTYIGVYVEDAGEYLIKKDVITQEQWDDDLMDDCPLEAQAVSYYSDEGYYVGFQVSPRSYKSFDELIAEFEEITGDKASIHQFVQWY